MPHNKLATRYVEQKALDAISHCSIGNRVVSRIAAFSVMASKSGHSAIGPLLDAFQTRQKIFGRRAEASYFGPTAATSWLIKTRYVLKRSGIGTETMTRVSNPWNPKATRCLRLAPDRPHQGRKSGDDGSEGSKDRGIKNNHGNLRIDATLVPQMFRVGKFTFRR